jgi:hypothetical protein
MTIAIGGGRETHKYTQHYPPDGTRSIGRRARWNGTPTSISKKGCGGCHGRPGYSRDVSGSSEHRSARASPARFRGDGLRLIVECGASAALDLQYARKRRGTVCEVYVAAVQPLAPVYVRFAPQTGPESSTLVLRKSADFVAEVVAERSEIRGGGI